MRPKYRTVGNVEFSEYPTPNGWACGDVWVVRHSTDEDTRISMAMVNQYPEVYKITGRVWDTHISAVVGEQALAVSVVEGLAAHMQHLPMGE